MIRRSRSASPRCRKPAGRRRGSRAEQAGHRPHPAAQLRHASARGGHRHPHHPGAARSRPAVDHGALHAGRHPPDRRHHQPAGSPEPRGDAAQLSSRRATCARGGGHLPPPRRRLSRRARRVPCPAGSVASWRAIEACRTAALGGHVEQCADCGEVRIAYNSCRNRHCPKCQGLARAQWLADRQAELLPVPYFHVVFTMPAPIAAIALQNKAVVYDILFKAAAETVRTIAADPKHLGAETGMIAVLHTWGQNLFHHPHVHCIVPGGGLSPDGSLGRLPARVLPVRARALPSLSPTVPGAAARPPSTPARCASSVSSPGLAEPAAFAAYSAAAAPDRMGRLRQATVRRAAAGARLSRPLHPSRRHHQQPPDRAR